MGGAKTLPNLEQMGRMEGRESFHDAQQLRMPIGEEEVRLMKNTARVMGGVQRCVEGGSGGESGRQSVLAERAEPIAALRSLSARISVL